MRISDWSSDVCSSDLVAAEYVGLTVAQLTDMRKKALQEGVFLKVAKNTLVSRAVENTDYAVVKDALTGPLLYAFRSEEHTSELQSLMRISYAVFCLKKKKQITQKPTHNKIAY